MTTRDLVLVAVFAALVAALGLVPPIPVGFTPVPVTLQTLGVMLCGLLLGPARGALACVVLLALVAAGFPLLAGGRGGLGVFVGPTAGFLYAWPLGAAASGAVARLAPPQLARRRLRAAWALAFTAAVAGGIGVVYLGGILWLGTVAGLGLQAAAVTSLVFVPVDLIKAALAAFAAVSVARALPESPWNRIE